MAAPSLMAVRRFSPSTRLRLQVVFAKGWEALAETYRLQAASFVKRLRDRLPVEEALDRYFREVGVPAPLVDTVRARTLISLSSLVDEIFDEVPEPEARPSGWSALRPDQMLDALKRRTQYIEETNLQCRLAASLSAEAVAATHIRMALETADLLVPEISPDEAIMHYIRGFNLPSVEAQIIFRRAMAKWAERDPQLDEALIAAPLAVSPSVPQIEFGGRLRLGIRAIG